MMATQASHRSKTPLNEASYHFGMIFSTPSCSNAFIDRVCIYEAVNIRLGRELFGQDSLSDNVENI